MRILITGGAGFQGSHLIERLLKKKHTVTVLNTPSAAAVKNLAPLRGRVETVWGSITDPEIVTKSVRDQDAVFHLAAYVNVDESLLHP
jgi:dTDP-glucose 4,6-dehydratase